MLFTNANVFTAVDAQDRASAFRVDTGVVTWVGDHPSAGDGETVIDLGGRTVLPGLLDLHTHPGVMATRTEFLDLLPPAVTTVAALTGFALIMYGVHVGWLVFYNREPDGPSS